MSTSNKPKRNIKKYKVRWERLIPSLVFSATIGMGISNIVKTFKDKNKDDDKKSIYYDLDYLDGELNNEFDQSQVTDYYMLEDFDIYQELENSETPIKIGCMSSNQSLKVYNFYSSYDYDGYEYLYCEIPESHFIGMIKTTDLSKGNIVSKENAEFNNIYIMNTKEDINVRSNLSPNSSSNFSLRKNDIVFVDQNEKVIDEDGKEVLKVRNGRGQLGYVEFNDCFKEIKDTSIVRFKADVDFSQLSSLNITDMSLDERMIWVRGFEVEAMARVLYYDDNGVLKTTAVYDNMLDVIDLSTIFSEIGAEKFNSDPDTKDPNALSKMSNNIIDWQNNISTGYYGIDISESMLPENLIYLLDSIHGDDSVKYGIVKLGASGYGSELPNLTYAKNSTVIYDENKKDITKKQVEIFKQRNIPVFGYFYSTSTNESEGLDIAQHIEACIDQVDKDLIPIVDVEMFGEGTEDRMYFLNNPNYNDYIQKGGKPVDLDYMKSLDEISLIQYVDSHPEVIEYINYCQDLMARSIASIYHKLNNDGYIKSDNILLYTGNKSVSNDSYKVTIKTDGDSFEKISLFKFSDVKEYLNNPNSPYYIPKSVNVWYADYTNQANYKVLGDAVAMHQFVGDQLVDGTNSSYDKNYVCKEFFDSIVETQKKNMLELDDMER